jgi:hypothetical protein
MTKKKNPSVFACALAANIIYYIICVLLYKINNDSQIANSIFFALSVIVWFGIGFFYSKKTADFTFSKGVKLVLLGFLPVIIFMLAYTGLLNMNYSNQTYNWTLFYNIGAPLLFWIKPAVFLINFFDVEFYIFAYVYIGVLFIASIAGACIPQILLHAKNKKKNEQDIPVFQDAASQDMQALDEAAIAVADDAEVDAIMEIEFQKPFDEIEDIDAEEDGAQAPNKSKQIGSSDLEADYDTILNQINFDNLQTGYSSLTKEENSPSSVNEEEQSNEKEEDHQ